MSTPPWGDDQQPQQPQNPYQQPYQPYGPPPQQPYGQQPYGQQPPAYGYPVAAQTNGMAVAALVVSIVSLMACCGASGFIGAILGHMSRGQIRRTGEQGGGMALAGVIVGWIGFGIFLLVALLYTGLIIDAIRSDDFSDY